MVNKRKAKWLKLGLVAAIACVNTGVYVIWPAAYMADATPEQKHRNDIFEKAEKAFFLVVDLGLNVTFLYLVRFRLIAHGLSKYWQLFNFNVAIVCLSTAMDAALLGMLSLPNPYLYVQFAPVVYIVKLHIELTMAALIAKIVQKTVKNGHSVYAHHSSRSRGRSYAKVQEPAGCGASATTAGSQSISYGNDVEIQKTSTGSTVPLAYLPGESGIMKTVTTTVIAEDNSEYKRSR
ncbi:hypothetical protein QQS21_006804 [Conoideocrella luteorostrata]|uniref:Uncharacterized protein n=1 Tax=Conoideocrella luteorostrata TaxID=1105319 RepID=A0AAJ0CM15_9HYPO|nr:hypothetical protein QQS21_006804 [Conoideocrella luteorostrata]